MPIKSNPLYIVATPIGNLSDISFRAIETLKTVDLIASEDTRNTSKLLNYYNIKKPLTSYHEHNKKEKTDYIIDFLKNKGSVALVSDAGMPLIQDPGDLLIKECAREDVEVFVIPGASALICALALSGFDLKSFCFEGFLPDNKKERKEKLEELKSETRTICIYVAPHDLKKILTEIGDIFGSDRQISLSKELTKKFERTYHGSINDVLIKLPENIKGEYVLVIEGKSKKEVEKEKADTFLLMTVREHLEKYLSKGYSESDAMKLVAKDRNVPKKEIYKEVKINNK